MPIAKRCAAARDVLFLGRGSQYPIALEGALKLKEISYIHAEGYAAGEMKHGPIALIDEELPVVVLATREPAYEKTLGTWRRSAPAAARVCGRLGGRHAGGEPRRRGAHRPARAAAPRPARLDHPAAVPRVPRRGSEGDRRRSAAEPGEERDGRVGARDDPGGGRSRRDPRHPPRGPLHLRTCPRAGATASSSRSSRRTSSAGASRPSRRSSAARRAGPPTRSAGSRPRTSTSRCSSSAPCRRRAWRRSRRPFAPPPARRARSRSRCAAREVPRTRAAHASCGRGSRATSRRSPRSSRTSDAASRRSASRRRRAPTPPPHPRPRPRRARRAGLGGALAEAAQDDGATWRAGELVLFESHLSPKGPRYEALVRAPLGGG